MRLLYFIIFFLVFSCTSKHNFTITTLDLSNKNLISIPDSVFSFDRLEHLELGNNFVLYPPLSAFKDSLENMNKITAIPKDIVMLRSLRTLGLRFNALTSLPNEIVQLGNLDSLDISFNQNLKIDTQLEIFKQMQRLKYLNIIATNADDRTIEKLRKLLPKTKIYSRLDYIESDTIQTF